MRLRWLVAGLLGLGLAGLLPGIALAQGCSNEQFRTGPSANLPDCRAYEQVSPVDKNDGAIGSPSDQFRLWASSLDGNKMAYSSSQAFADAQSGASVSLDYLASRGAAGWSSQSLLPPQAVSPVGIAAPYFHMVSSDLSRAVLFNGGGSFTGQDDPPLVSGEPLERPNLFVRENSSGSYQLVNVTPAGVTPNSPVLLEGASPDLSHVVFMESAKLTANALGEGNENLYEWSGGVVRLVSVLPGGAAMRGRSMLLVNGSETKLGTVSEDGSRIFFGGEGGGLYMREDGLRTVQVDASQGPGAGGGGQFMAASGDGSKVFFLADSGRGLTNDTVPGSGGNLYEYDVAAARLTDLTPATRAEVLSSLGASRDGSYLYFVAQGDLAAGAIVGQPNLYVWHEGVTTYIATLSPGVQGTGDSIDWAPGDLTAPAISVTADGTRLAFESVMSLTGYDNTDVNTGSADTEVFLYDAVANRLVCASCNPSGARPLGSSLITPPDAFGEEDRLEGHRPHYLSEDGSRLFFNSFDALSPRDTNGREDVYEYEGAHVYLISGGTDSENSQFADASASGGDVFFTTAQPLVAQDRDPRLDLYDARVGGGFPSPVVPAPCAGEGCRLGAVASGALSVPGSATFSGAGNLALSTTPAAKAKAKAKAKKRKARKRKRRVRARRRARGARLAAGSHSTGKRG